MSKSHGRFPIVALTSMLALALLLALAAAPPASAGMKQVPRKATKVVRTWKSPKAYTAPAVVVRVSQRGRRLAAAPVSNCKAHYYNHRIDVLISTCGKRWRVKARYVSLIGKRQRFRIAYSPQG